MIGRTTPSAENKGGDYKLFPASIPIILDQRNSTCKKYTQLQTHLSLLTGAIFKMKVSWQQQEQEQEHSVGLPGSGRSSEPNVSKEYRWRVDLSHQELVLQCMPVSVDVF